MKRFILPLLALFVLTSLAPACDPPRAVIRTGIGSQYSYAENTVTPSFLLVPQRQVFVQRQQVVRDVGPVVGVGSSSNIVVSGRGRSVVSQQSNGLGGSSSNIVVNQSGGGLLGRLFGGGNSTVISQQSR